MNFKKLALVSLASAAVLGAAQTAVHADEATDNTVATSSAVAAAQAKVTEAQAKVTAAQEKLTTATNNVTTAQATVDSETAGLEQLQKDAEGSGQPADLISGEVTRRNKLIQDAKDDLAAAQTLQTQAQQAFDTAQSELTAAQEELAAAQKAAEKPAEETATVKVRVADQDGKPVAGASVEFLVDNGGTQVETGADGYATFTAKKGTEVTARLAKYDEANYTYVFENKELVADDSANNNVALIELTKKPSTTPVKPAEETATVKVRVADLDGNPVAGTTVEFLVDNAGTQIETGKDGYATFTAKKGTEVTARLAKYDEANYTYVFENKELVADDSANNNVALIELAKKATNISTNNPTDGSNNNQESLPALSVIRVVDNGSNPVAGAKVEFSTDGFSTGHQVVTDENGYATFEAQPGDKVQARLAALPEAYEYNQYVETIDVTANGANGGFIAVDKKASTTPETPAKDASLTIKVVSEGRAQEGVNVDVMVNGKVVNVGTTDAKGQVIVHAKEGDKVDYRVATVPAGYVAPKAASTTLKEGANNVQVTVNKAGSTTDDNNTPAPTPAAKDATLLITVVSDGQAREGVAVDVMVNGKVVNVGTTDAKGQVIVHAKEGDKVDYRVATVPAGYVAPAAASATLKAGENTAQITVNKAGSTTPTDNKPETPTEAATFTLSVVDSASKAPLSGVAIDLMVAGKVTTATTDANGQVAVSAKAGDVVKYRVAVTPAGYKSNTVAYDATLVKGANSATLALEAEGTTPTPTPQPEPQPTPDSTNENTTNARYGFYAYEDVNKDGKFYDRFRTVQTYEDIFGNYNYSYVMAMANKNKK